MSWRLSTIEGRSFISVGDAPAFRVDAVNADGEHFPIGEYSDIEDANRLADWFGRDGRVRAEVVPMESEVPAERSDGGKVVA